jgi:hypothetical protein
MERARDGQLVIELCAHPDRRERRRARAELEHDGQPSVLEHGGPGAGGDRSASQPANEAHANLWGAFIRSGMVSGGDVLVDEAAEPVVFADRGGWLDDGRKHIVYL